MISPAAKHSSNERLSRHSAPKAGNGRLNRTKTSSIKGTDQMTLKASNSKMAASGSN